MDTIAQWMLDELKKEEGVDFSGDKAVVQMLKEAAEKAKIELSGAMSAKVGLSFIADDKKEYRNYGRNLTRAKFEELTSDLVEKIAIPVRNVMEDAAWLDNKDSKQVILVGGAARIAAVQKKIRQLAGMESGKYLNHDECVAIGASVLGGKLEGSLGTDAILLLDATPLSLCIEAKGGKAIRLIERNTTIPTIHSQIFSTCAVRFYSHTTKLGTQIQWICSFLGHYKRNLSLSEPDILIVILIDHFDSSKGTASML